MRARKPRRLDKGEHELHLALVELEFGALRDLVTTLAGRYPNRETRGTGAVWDALQHLLAVVRLIARRYSKVRKKARVASSLGQ